MDYKKLNEILEDLKNVKGTLITQKEDDDDDQTITIYDVGIPEVYLKVTTQYNSYGDYAGVCSIQFVKPVVKQITDFEVL